MRAMYGFLGFLAVLVLVAFLYKKQLDSVGSNSLSSSGQATQAATLKMQQQLIKQSVEASMNRAHSVEESP